MKRGIKGFTLIELMVVVGIIIVLSGLALAGYYRFTQKQEADSEARNFVTIMRKVQSMAKNLVYPTGCNNLTGYRVFTECSVYNDGCNKLSYSAVCGGSEVSVVRNEPVLNSAYFASQVNYVLRAVSGTVEPVGTIGLGSDGPYEINIAVDAAGNFSTNVHETSVD